MRFAAAALTAVALQLLAALPAEAGCATRKQLNHFPLPGDTLGIVPGPEVPLEVVEEAVAVWQRCPNYGLGFPALVIGRGQARTLEVRLRHTSLTPACGRFRGHRIDLFAFATDARGQIRHCGSLGLILAHEIGHVFGLADAREAACREHIMAGIEESTRYRRQVHDAECQAVSQRWLTDFERRAAGPPLDLPGGP